jgi:hypothetical protein
MRHRQDWMPAAFEIGRSGCTRALTREVATMRGTAIKLAFKKLNSDSRCNGYSPGHCAENVIDAVQGSTASPFPRNDAGQVHGFLPLDSRSAISVWNCGGPYAIHSPSV